MRNGREGEHKLIVFTRLNVFDGNFSLGIRNEIDVEIIIISQIKIWKIENENEYENRNETGEDTYAGALRAPRAGSPAFVSVFVFVLIFGFSNFYFYTCTYSYSIAQ